MSGIFQFLSSPKVSFIVSLAGLLIYLFFNSLLGRNIESLDDKLLFPAAITWGVFSAALIYHAASFLLSILNGFLKSYKSGRKQIKKDIELKNNAKLYFDNLDQHEIRVMFELFESSDYTSRLDRLDSSVSNLKALGMINLQKSISVFEAVYCLNKNVIDYTRKAYIPYYFDNVKKYYNENDEYAQKLFDLFYVDDAENKIVDEDNFLHLVQHFERADIISREVDIDNEVVYLVLNDMFVLYLDKVLLKPPVRRVVKI